jgi:hypothetical protein
MDNSISDLMNSTVFNDEVVGTNDHILKMNQSIKERINNKSQKEVSETSSP